MPTPDNPETTCIQPQGDIAAALPSDRPLVTFILVGYNQERFIREAVEGAFAQTYTPLEIILSDDCSTDRTFEIMKEMAAQYKGPHKIILNRNERNLGLCGHLNRCVELTHGELIVIAAGDDVSLPERTSVLTSVYSRSRSKYIAIFSDAELICEDGTIMVANYYRINQNNINKKLELIPYNNRYSISCRSISLNNNCFIAASVVHGATAAYSREIFVAFGPIKYCGYEDLVLSYRTNMIGTIIYIPRPMVKYRYSKGAQYMDNSYSQGSLEYEYATVEGIMWNEINKIADLKTALTKGFVSRDEGYAIIREAKATILRCKIIIAEKNNRHISFVFYALYLIIICPNKVKNLGWLIYRKSRSIYHILLTAKNIIQDVIKWLKPK